jgi:sarcosine oxidase
LFDIIVIGRGLFGASAVRHLSQSTTSSIALIGPGEPSDPASHQGIYGAHYDEGRLTYQLKSDPVWAGLAVASLARYPALEAASGKRFHSPAGSLYLADPNMDNGRFAAAQSPTSPIPTQQLDHHQLQARFPYLKTAENVDALWEGPPAGHFSPRTFLQAQLALAGATTLIDDIATGAAIEKDKLVVLTANNGRFQAKKVLVAAGAYSNGFNLLPRPLSLRLKQEYVIRALLPDTEVARFKDMPPIVYRIDHPRLAELYILPPIRYPDGRFYLKMGANTVLDQFVESVEAINGWYRQGDSDRLLPDLRDMVLSLFPNLKAESWHTHRCVITRTAHGRPYIDTVVAGQLYLAAGGNGQGAKAADEVGRLAARMLADGESPGDYFSAVFQTP